MVSFWNPGSGEDPDDGRDPKKPVTRRQLLVRFAFYAVLFAALIWWAKS